MGKVSNYEVILETGKKIGKGIGYTAGYIYAFPTLVNSFCQKRGDAPFDSLAIGFSYALSMGVSVLNGFFLSLDDFITTESSPKKFLAISGLTLMTNTISAGYELAKHIKKQMQERLKENEREGLEGVLEVQ